jgi:hypothetical protein
MIKGKIIFVIVLYIALGVIAFFNFGLYGHLVAKVERKNTANEAPWKKFGENIRKARSASQEATQDPSQEATQDPSPDQDSTD